MIKLSKYTYPNKQPQLQNHTTFHKKNSSLFIERYITVVQRVCIELVMLITYRLHIFILEKKKNYKFLQG